MIEPSDLQSTTGRGSDAENASLKTFPDADQRRYHSRIPELDGIRGLAITMVLVWHYFNCLTGPVERRTATFIASRLTTLAWSGVDLFFVLSGFLIGGILLDNSNNLGFTKSFFIRRLFRIVPAYCIFLITFHICGLLLNRNQFGWAIDSNISIFSCLLMCQNFAMAIGGSFGSNSLGVTWSLAVEEQFYCLIITIFLAFGARRASRILLQLAVAAVVIRLLMPGFHAYVLLPFRMDSLGFGFAVACVIRSEKALTWCLEHCRDLLITLVLLLLSAGAATWKGGMGELQHTFLAILYGFVVLLAVLNTGHSSMAILRCKALSMIGLYSYSIYLFHQLILGLMHGYFLGQRPAIQSTSEIAITLGALVITFGLSSIIYHTIEKPFIQVGKRYSYSPDKSHGRTVAGLTDGPA